MAKKHITKKGVCYSVDSSNIKRIAHVHDVVEGKESNQVLMVEFKNGKSYAYYFVPVSVLKELMKAESIGKRFYALIKGKYQYDEITRTQWDSKFN